jgi:UDP-glucose 4-epimerase
VADTVRALSSLMDSPITSGEIYNVGSQQSISIRDLAQRVLEMTRSGSDLKYVPYEEVYGLGIEDMYHRVPATEKIDAAVGWRATLDLDVVLADVIKHLGTAGAAGDDGPQREEARSGASAASAARTASE